MKFVFTSDDAGGSAPGTIERFEQVVGWLDGRGIPSTFFWIPKPGGKPGDQDSDWIRAAEQARAKGHDFQLHGLTHHCLEFGLPQESIRRHAPGNFEQYEADTEHWRAEHSIEEQRRKFAEAVAIFGRAFAESPLVFRAPCLGIGATAYQAMSEQGIRCSSSRSINPAATGYMLTRRTELEAWQPDYDGRPFVEPPGVTEIPCLEDLVIGGVKAGEFDLALGLFKRDIANYVAALGDAPFGVFACHFNRVGSQMDVIPRLYEQLFEWMSDELGITEWTTFKDALA